MKIIRFFVGKLILLLNALFPSKVLVQRDPTDQKRVEEQTKNLMLYQYDACPFCVKVRRAARSLGLTLQIKDAKNINIQSELVAMGGKKQVPCLRIEDQSGKVTWLYESKAIISYLTDRFGSSLAA